MNQSSSSSPARPPTADRLKPIPSPLRNRLEDICHRALPIAAFVAATVVVATIWSERFRATPGTAPGSPASVVQTPDDSLPDDAFLTSADRDARCGEKQARPRDVAEQHL
jgi:hypothetical protein